MQNASSPLRRIALILMLTLAIAAGVGTYVLFLAWGSGQVGSAIVGVVAAGCVAFFAPRTDYRHDHHGPEGSHRVRNEALRDAMFHRFGRGDG